MFDFVQKNTVFIKVILGAVALTFVGFGVGSYATSQDDPYLAKVDGNKIYKQDIDRVLNGKPADNATRQQVLDSLIRQQLLLADARAAGLRISDEELRRAIASVPVFQEGGKFSPVRYQQYLESQYLSPTAFEQKLRDDLLLQKQLSAFVDSSFVTRGAVSRVQQLLGERREIAEYRLNASDFLKDITIDDAAIKKFYDANANRFRTPEAVRVEYLVLSQDEVAKNIAVNDDEARRYFDEHKSELGQEERKVAHILLTVDKNATAAQKAKVKAEAEAIAREVAAKPTSFAQVATARSQDPGSAAKGGDLGWFGHGAMVKPFEDAAFKLAKGQISGVVETEFGYHVLKLEDIKTPDFESSKADIVARLARQKAGATFREQNEKLGDIAYQQSDSLKPAAEQLKLKIETSDWIVRGQPAPGLLAGAKVQAAVFADDVLKGKHNSEPVEAEPGKVVVARIVEHRPAALQPLDKVAAAIRAELAGQEALQRAIKQGQAKLADLQAGKGGEPAFAAAYQVSRNQPGKLGMDAARSVFAAKAHGKLPVYAGSQDANGYTVYRIGKLIAPEAATPEQLQQLSGMLAQSQANIEASSYIAGLREKFKVTVKQMPAE